jgi:hypothetical protein
MTGGAGFARQGKDQFDNNRKIRQIRTPLKDQAYQQDSKAYSGSLEDYEQLKVWQNQRREEVKKLSFYIWGFLGLLIAVLLGILLLLF